MSETTSLSDIAEEMREFFALAERIRMIGGIALEAVMDGKATIPVGWVLEPSLNYYVPPSFLRGEGVAIQ